MRWVCALLLAAFASLCLRPASAHALAPLGVAVKEHEGGRVTLRIKRSRVQPRGARFAPRLPPHCRILGAPEVAADERQLTERYQLQCDHALESSELGIDGLRESGLDAVLRIELANGVVHRALLTSRHPSFVVPQQSSRLAVAQSYLWLGSSHMLSGLDHVLFVLGMTLLVSRRRRLLLVLTAFTVGHSVTLCVSALGFLGEGLGIRAGLVEVAIALSLVWLALEVVHRRSGEQGRWLWPVAAAFGLLHGLGFASALAETGLPATEIPLALACFNVGVELAQLAVVFAALLLAQPLSRWLPDNPTARRLLPGYALGGIAAMWLIERGLLLTRNFFA